MHFDPHRYTRSLVALDKHFSLLVICWNKSQKTPIHDHGDACTSWIRVISGSLCVGSSYEPTPCGEKVNPKSVLHLEAGKSATLPPNLGDHSTYNCFKGEQCRTVSLHLFTPPYIECRFSETGAPSNELSYIPVVHCPQAKNYLQGNEELRTLKKCQNRQFFGNFSQLVEVLREEVIISPEGRHSPENISQVCKILEQIQFNPKEWEQYSKFENGHYTRNLIGYDEKFTILLLCWEKGQFSPIHDHAGSNCWVKVLQGELEETLYDLGEDGVEVKLRKSTVYQPGGVTYISDLIGVHKMGNPSSSTACCSLHVYSPAYHQCHIFAEAGEQPYKKEVSITTAYGTVFPFMEKSLQCSSMTCKKHISSLSTLVTLLKEEFAAGFQDEHISNLLGSLNLSTTEWNQYLHFSPHQYTRNLVAYDEQFSLVLVCWNHAQKTPVHDHGKNGRLAWVKVMSGSLKFRKYAENEFKQVEPLDDNPILLSTGETIKLIDDELGLHQTMNPSKDEVAVSLHLYAPPYVECQFKGVTGEKRLIPVAYCSKEAGMELTPKLDLGEFHQNVFTSMATFCGLLNRTFVQAAGAVSKAQIKRIIEQMTFNETEWKHIACCCPEQPTRTLVGHTKDFSVHVICWEVDQKSPIHDHSGSSAWVKVLEGALREKRYTKSESGKLVPGECRKLSKHETHLLEDDIIHETCNVSPGRTYTLHVYSPPFKRCGCYNIETNDCSMCPCDYHIRE